VPTGGTNDNTTQWGMFYTTINATPVLGSCAQPNAWNRAVCALKLPRAGYRDWYHDHYQWQGTSAIYQSSSPTGIVAHFADLYPDGGNIANTTSRGNALSVRCIKN
jgi:hypothetical protein